jgi:hypothetical protein
MVVPIIRWLSPCYIAGNSWRIERQFQFRVSCSAETVEIHSANLRVALHLDCERVKNLKSFGRIRFRRIGISTDWQECQSVLLLTRKLCLRVVGDEYITLSESANSD